MLKFNHLLGIAGLDPALTRLTRHRVNTTALQRKVRDAAVQRDLAFQRYQERQRDLRVIQQFRAAVYIAAFFADPATKETVFAGVWKRLGERSKLLGDPISPDSGVNDAGIVEFDTTRVELFDEYVGRLVIDWGDGARSWVQRADNRNKPILQIRQAVSDPDFPGFSRFQHRLDEIRAIYSSWAQVLRNARGVYLLVHRTSGQQYVGSAYGAGGFYERWCSYADGHGGNVGMKELGAPANSFDACILEVVGSSATTDDIFERESRWKKHLGTLAVGLNRN